MEGLGCRARQTRSRPEFEMNRACMFFCADCSIADSVLQRLTASNPDSSNYK